MRLKLYIPQTDLTHFLETKDDLKAYYDKYKSPHTLEFWSDKEDLKTCVAKGTRIKEVEIEIIIK